MSTKCYVVYYAVLVVLNFVSLYFVVDLMSYDQMVGALSSGAIKSESISVAGYSLFLTIMADINLLALLALKKIAKSC